MSGVLSLLTSVLYVVRHLDATKETRMKKSRLNAMRLMKSPPRKKFRYFKATLLSPVEVEDVTHNWPSGEREDLQGRWFAHGVVNQKMYAAFQAQLLGDFFASMTVVTSFAGAEYLILTNQTGHLQHRFVFPMYDQKVLDFLASASNQPLNINLSSVDVQNHELRYECLLSDDIKLLKTVDSVPENQNFGAFEDELPRFLGDVFNPSLIESVSTNQEVREVNVSVLMPTRDSYSRIYEAVSVAGR